jgi:hypothetical protein
MAMKESSTPPGFGVNEPGETFYRKNKPRNAFLANIVVVAPDAIVEFLK